MKILIVYTPRSKSTYLYQVLTKKYNLDPFGDRLTKSRIKNKSFVEYEDIINEMNSANNICVKINGNDFIDTTNHCIHTQFKDIDFASFDKIIFVTRKNYLDAVLSYAYMNPADSDSWHKKVGELKIGFKYTVDPAKVFYLLRGYRVFDLLRTYIETVVPLGAHKIHYEYDDVDVRFPTDFELSPEDLRISIEANGIDYRHIATNYNEISQLVPQVARQMLTAPYRDINDPHSFFWRNNR